MRPGADGHVQHVPRVRIPDFQLHGRPPRASGFLQVALSKVSRHSHRGARPASSAEIPPMNANDLSGVICRRPSPR